MPESINLKLPQQYGIWAEAGAENPLTGSGAYLRKEKELMLYDSKDNARFYLNLLESLRLTKTPSVRYSIKPFPRMDGVTIPVADMEAVRLLDMEHPAFDPHNFEIRETGYENTGGGCMVATMEFYLPELDKSVWMSSNDESIIVAPYDCTIGLYHADEYVESSHYSFLQACYADPVPEAAAPWKPMLDEALLHTAEQESRHYGRPVTRPAHWLPESIQKTAEPEYFSWLESQGKHPEIMGGQIIMDPEYVRQDQSQGPELGTMGLQ